MFRSLLLRRAARRYAKRLPDVLHQGYGASEQYTPAQIAAAVRRADLPQQYIAIGYAAFLAEDAFRRQVPDGDYLALRTLFKTYVTNSPAYGVEPLNREYPGSTTSGFG